MTAHQGNFSEAGVGTFSTNTAQTLWSKDISEWPICAGGAFVRCVARRVSDGAAKSWFMSIAFKHDGGGASISATATLATLGETLELVALATVALAFDVDESSIRARVTVLNGQDFDVSIVVDGMVTYHNEPE